MKVLLVDDEPDFLEQLSILLEKENDRLDIDATTSANSALEKIREIDYDAVVSDYYMPEMDGLDFLVALRDGGYDLPFILLTGKGREEVAMEALNLGADRYVRKRLEPKYLARVIAETIVCEIDEPDYEKDLRESKERFQSIFKELGIPTVVIDRDGIIKLANKKFESLSGYSERDLVGKKKLHDFIPKDKEGKIVKNPVSLAEENEVNKDTFKEQFKDKNGTVHDVKMDFSSMNSREFVVSISKSKID